MSAAIDTVPATANRVCCRACGAPLARTVADLGLSPLANSYVPPARAGQGEMATRSTPMSASVAGWSSSRRSRARSTSSLTTPTSRASRPVGCATRSATSPP